MKKRFYFVAIIAILLYGCSSDSDGGIQINEQNVLGKWYFKGSKYNNDPFENYQNSCSTLKDFNEIFSNHQIIFTGYGINCEVNDTQNSQWTLDGNVFTIIYDDGFTEPDVYQIIKLTNTEMRLKQTNGTDSYLYDLNKL